MIYLNALTSIYCITQLVQVLPVTQPSAYVSLLETIAKQSLPATFLKWIAVMRTQQIKDRSLSLPGYLCTKQVLGPVMLFPEALPRNMQEHLAMITTRGVNNECTQRNNECTQRTSHCTQWASHCTQWASHCT